MPRHPKQKYVFKLGNRLRNDKKAKSSVLQQNNKRILKRYKFNRILPLAIRRKEVLSICFYLAILSCVAACLAVMLFAVG